MLRPLASLCDADLGRLGAVLREGYGDRLSTLLAALPPGRRDGVFDASSTGADRTHDMPADEAMLSYWDCRRPERVR
jgi:hypothetical protein